MTGAVQLQISALPEYVAVLQLHVGVSGPVMDSKIPGQNGPPIHGNSHVAGSPMHSPSRRQIWTPSERIREVAASRETMVFMPLAKGAGGRPRRWSPYLWPKSHVLRFSYFDHPSRATLEAHLPKEKVPGF